jgi:hypothetical protein
MRDRRRSFATRILEFLSEIVEFCQEPLIDFSRFAKKTPQREFVHARFAGSSEPGSFRAANTSSTACSRLRLSTWPQSR